MGTVELGIIGDFHSTYLNKDAIITLECWNEVEKGCKPEEFEVLRGLFGNEFPETKKKDTIESTIMLLNYLSRTTPIILITKRSKRDYEKRGLETNYVDVKSIAEMVKHIREDGFFPIWKAQKLWEMQKFKGKTTE